MTPTTKTIVLSDGREITLQTGKLAEQAGPLLLNTRRSSPLMDVSPAVSPVVRAAPATMRF